MAKRTRINGKKSQRYRAPLTSEALPVIGVPTLPIGVCGRQMSVLAPSSADGITPKPTQTAHPLSTLGLINYNNLANNS